MVLQWAAGIILALIVSPKAWAGLASTVHPHVWAATLLGGLITAGPVVMAFWRPGEVMTRHCIAIAQMLISALLIHLTGGRVETHFHVFGSLAFLAIYRDWRVLITATIVTGLDHFLRGYFWPQSIYGVFAVSAWRWVEHVGWVFFEGVFLILFQQQSLREMRNIAQQQADLEALNTTFESKVVARTAELAETKAQVQAILDGATQVAMIATDTEGLITVFNPGAAKMLGYRSEEMVGRQTPAIFHLASEIEAAREELSAASGREIEGFEGTVAAVRHGSRQGRDWTFIRKDGTHLRVTMEVTDLVDTQGRTTGYLGVAKDVTERRRTEQALRESEERFREIANHIEGAFWIATADERMLYMSPIFEKLWGRSIDALYQDIGTLWAAVHPEDLPLVAAGKASIARGEKMEVEHRIIRPDGTVCWIRARIFPIFSATGQVVRVCGISEDITERRQMLEELDQARQAALESARLKSQFLANMSHEIRSPMNGVLGMTHLLLDTKLDGEQRECAETIRASAEALLTIINDILDFSKIEAGKLEFETVDFDLHEVMEGTLDLLAGEAHRKGLEFAGFIDPDVPTHLRGDPGRLRQVLTNLVSNAVKFTRQGEVTVRIGLVSEDTSHARLAFRVMDTGIGIPPEAQSRLFQAFSQADGSTTRRFGGTGLGLAICKQLVEQMDGNIGFETVPGQGSTFFFSVALAKQEPARRLREGDHELLHTRVLIVENHTASAQFLEAQFAAWKVRYGSVRSGAKALSELRRAVEAGDPYGLALVDLQMPGMDGLALARAIKLDPTLAPTRLLLLAETGKRLPEAELATIGIAEVRSKPLRHSTLFDCLAGIMHDQPLTPAEIAPSTAEAEAVAEAHPERVLLVEDSTINQRVAVRQLRKLGYHNVEIAANGFEAVQATQRCEYDLVIMDCQMPEMDGYEATQEIRRQEAGGQRLRIIAMTANSMAGDREKCIESGMDDYVSKPVRIEELASALHRAREAAPTAPEPEADDSPIDQDSVAQLRALEEDGEEESVLTELITLFFRDAPGTLDRLAEAVTQNDAKETVAAAHLLKSNAGHFGAHRLQELCATIEKDARANDLTSAPERLRSIRAEFQRVLHALEELAPPHTP